MERTPIVELSGQNITTPTTGLLINAGPSTVKGLVINRWMNGNGIILRGAAGNHTIQGNYIGVDVTGSIALPNLVGISVQSPNSVIGGTTIGERNVISGNTGPPGAVGTGINVNGQVTGVALVGTGSGTTILGNFIGLNAAGTAAIPNSNGMFVTVPNVTIGTTAGGNAISGNQFSGILTGAQTPGGGSTTILATPTGTLIQNNRIGTNLAGTFAIANGGDGVTINAGNAQIGGTGASQGNLLSGNTSAGVSMGLASTRGASPQYITQSSNVIVEGNTIGLNAAGTAAIPNVNAGVRVNSANARIGGTVPGAGNVIAGNTGAGIAVGRSTLGANVSAGTGAQILGNFIGTDAAGAASIGNGSDGIRIINVSTVTVGSPGAGRNVISGNGNNGAVVGSQAVFVNPSSISMSGIQVVGNYIGVTPSGTAARANYIGVGFASSGGFTVTGTLIDRNVISGNVQFGVNLGTSGATGTLITGNVIGLNAAGTASIANIAGGIFVPSPNTVIGGTTAANANVISGNSGNGISLTTGATGSQVLGNFIGTNAAGAATLAQHELRGVDHQRLEHYCRRSGRRGDERHFRQRHGDVLWCGYHSQWRQRPHHSWQSHRHQRGGDQRHPQRRWRHPDQRLQHHHHWRFACRRAKPDFREWLVHEGRPWRLASGIAVNNQILGNYIGTDVSGAAILGNNSSGVSVGGTASGRLSGRRTGNVISGNGKNGFFGAGVNLQTGSTGTSVQGNRIGTDAAGNVALPNANGGLNVNSSNSNVIGGTAAGAGNLISGNGSGTGLAGDPAEGIGIFGTSTGNTVYGNLIGTNADGSAALGNGFIGVIVNGSSNTIGGTGTASNLISGNLSHDVQISGGSSNQVLNNLIGTNGTGTAGIGNAQNGVQIDTAANNNLIGGVLAGTGNTIAYNTGRGVAVQSGTGNAIRSNSIHSNGNLGIDLGSNGPTSNDLGDGDAGANNVQNFPSITAANAGSTIVDGTFNSAANTTFTLDFFASATCDPSTFGEGQRYLGSTAVVTDGTGNVAYSVILGASLTAGESITATATDPLGNTSEFSACVVVP